MNRYAREADKKPRKQYTLLVSFVQENRIVIKKDWADIEIGQKILTTCSEWRSKTGSFFCGKREWSNKLAGLNSHVFELPASKRSPARQSVSYGQPQSGSKKKKLVHIYLFTFKAC